MKKAALKNFAIFIGKHLRWNLFLIKVQTFRSATLLKKRLQRRCFHVNIAKFLGTVIFKDICKRLLLMCIHLELYPNKKSHKNLLQ